MKIGTFTFIGFVLALISWFFESCVHYLIFDEQQFRYIPDDLNELWMRIVIFMLIFFYGVFSDLFVDRILHKQLEVAHTYHDMLFTSRHILVNVVNQMKLFRVEARKSKDFNPEIIDYYDQTINEACDLIETLKKIEIMSREI